MHIVSNLTAGWAKDRGEHGAALVEYALLLALIAIVCILAITTLGEQAAQNFTTVGDSIAAAGN